MLLKFGPVIRKACLRDLLKTKEGISKEMAFAVPSLKDKCFNIRDLDWQRRSVSVSFLRMYFRFPSLSVSEICPSGTAKTHTSAPPGGCRNTLYYILRGKRKYTGSAGMIFRQISTYLHNTWLMLKQIVYACFVTVYSKIDLRIRKWHRFKWTRGLGKHYRLSSFPLNMHFGQWRLILCIFMHYIDKRIKGL